MPYGRLHVEDPCEFEGPRSASEQVDEALDALRLRAGMPLITPPVQDWPQIVDCVVRGGGFAVEAERTPFKARLSFDPTAANLGDYEIRLATQRETENGRVTAVSRVDDAELWKHEYESLRAFPMRYVVTTASSRGLQRVWLIGMTATREGSPDAPDA